MKSHPLFITLEGGEGAGKSTLLKKLAHELKQRDYEVVITREPGGSLLGKQIRQWLLNRNESILIHSVSELLLFLADRAQHLEEVIKPALANGKVVICDRFNDSTVAYQGGARGLGVEFVQNLCDLVCQNVKPDITFLLDIDPLEGLKRTRAVEKDSAALGDLDRIETESMNFHLNVREVMQELARRNPDRIVTIDASQSVDQVFEKALSVLQERFLQPRPLGMGL